MIVNVPAVVGAQAFPRGTFSGYAQATEVAGVTAAERSSGASVLTSIAIGVGTGVVFWLLERWILNPLFGRTTRSRT